MKFIDKNTEKLSKKDITKYILYLILIVGILVRVVGIANFPNALNCDEASAGYDAYSILNYGIDRNGNVMPAFLVAWGSGQNALLSYLMIPFIKILGLNVLSVRLPMAILSSVSLVIMYLLLKKISNKKLALIGLTFFAICPWHIMKSRWGLESNLFPDLILIFVYLLIKGIEDKNKILYYLAFVIAGISAYSYGTSYFFLPFFIIPILIFLIKKKKINIKQAIFSLLIVGIVSMPIILMVIINTFNLQQINFPFLTIPKMEVNRFQVMTSVFSSEFLSTSISNFVESVKILVLQTDGLPWNSILPFGLVYIFSGIFTLVGIINSFSKRKKLELKYNYIFNIWFIVCVILTFICEPNINRLNIMMIPIIYYTIVGIYMVVDYFNSKNIKMLNVLILILYIVFFVAFIVYYLKQDSDEYGTFEAGLDEVVQYVNAIDNKEIYITNTIKESYIYVLFYSQYDTREFIDTVEYENPNAEFRKVLGFGKYKFDNISEIENGNVYVIKKKDREKYDLEDKIVIEFDKYLVIE